MDAVVSSSADLKVGAGAYSHERPGGGSLFRGIELNILNESQELEFGVQVRLESQ